MTESNPLPTAGAIVGHYKLMRQVAQGPFGPLYELRAEADADSMNGLARLIAVPSDLAPGAAQRVTEAAWDSMEIRNDYALCVADLVFGPGWVALIHDHSEGSVLRSLQRRCQEKHSAFPLNIALRVVLDVLDGLDATQRDCASSGISWTPGGASATSLYLCGNGRTRSLDGQLIATLLRTEPIRDQSNAVGFPAPELLSQTEEPDERTDVFCAGTVLWELLTGRELSVGNAILRGQRQRPGVAKLEVSVPKGTASLPSELAQAVQSAVDLDPANRLPTRDAFRRAITSNADVATYAQVIDFTDSLLHRESTLFRLNLGPGPKLSDEKRGERPKAPRLEWVVELAKQAQSRNGHRTAMASRAPPKPQSRQSIPSQSGTKPFNPKPLPPPAAPAPPALTTQVRPAPATKLDKPLAKNTLMGLSPAISTSATQRDADKSQQRIAQPSAVEPSTSATTTTQGASRPTATTPGAGRSFAKQTSLGLGSASSVALPAPNRVTTEVIAEDEMVAVEVRPSEPSTAATPITVHGVVSIRSPEKSISPDPAPKALSLLQAELIDTPSAVTEPSPRIDDNAPPPGAVPLFEPASFDSKQTLGARSPQAKPARRRVFQLSLTTIILGLGIAVGVAVLATILLVERSGKTSATRAAPTTTVPALPPTPRESPSAPTTTVPALTTVPAAEPSPTVATTTTAEPPPSVAASPAAPDASAAPSSASLSEPKTPAGPQHLPHTEKSKPPETRSATPPKSSGRARPRQYVPSEL